jgi:hypothetical protein
MDYNMLILPYGRQVRPRLQRGRENKASYVFSISYSENLCFNVTLSVADGRSEVINSLQGLGYQHSINYHI